MIICFQYSFSQGGDPEFYKDPIEEIDYSLKYGIFKIGDAHIEFGYDQNCRGAFIQAYAKSTGLLRLIKDIHFQYDCCMDTLTGLPVTDSRILIQGDHVDTSTVYYDHVTREDSSLVYSINTDTVVVPKNIYDLLSGFYHYREECLEDGLPLNHSDTTTTFFIDEIWDLIIRYFGKEIIDTDYGSIECLKVKPVTIIGRYFRTTEAMTMWFTNNNKQIPVKFLIELRLGTLYGNITTYKYRGNNIVIN